METYATQVLLPSVETMGHTRTLLMSVLSTSTMLCSSNACEAIYPRPHSTHLIPLDILTTPELRSSTLTSALVEGILPQSVGIEPYANPNHGEDTPGNSVSILAMHEGGSLTIHL